MSLFNAMGEHPTAVYPKLVTLNPSGFKTHSKWSMNLQDSYYELLLMKGYSKDFAHNQVYVNNVGGQA